MCVVRMNDVSVYSSLVMMAFDLGQAGSPDALPNVHKYSIFQRFDIIVISLCN